MPLVFLRSLMPLSEATVALSDCLPCQYNYSGTVPGARFLYTYPSTRTYLYDPAFSCACRLLRLATVTLSPLPLLQYIFKGARLAADAVHPSDLDPRLRAQQSILFMEPSTHCVPRLTGRSVEERHPVERAFGSAHNMSRAFTESRRGGVQGLHLIQSRRRWSAGAGATVGASPVCQALVRAARDARLSRSD